MDGIKSWAIRLLVDWSSDWDRKSKERNKSLSDNDNKVIIDNTYLQHANVHHIGLYTTPIHPSSGGEVDI